MICILINQSFVYEGRRPGLDCESDELPIIEIYYGCRKDTAIRSVEEFYDTDAIMPINEKIMQFFTGKNSILIAKKIFNELSREDKPRRYCIRFWPIGNKYEVQAYTFSGLSNFLRIRGCEDYSEIQNNKLTIVKVGGFA